MAIMALTPTTRSLSYIDVLKDARIGKTGNFTRIPANVKMRVGSKIVNLAATAVEK